MLGYIKLYESGTDKEKSLSVQAIFSLLKAGYNNVSYGTLYADKPNNNKNNIRSAYSLSAGEVNSYNPASFDTPGCFEVFTKTKPYLSLSMYTTPPDSETPRLGISCDSPQETEVLNREIVNQLDKLSLGTSNDVPLPLRINGLLKSIVCSFSSCTIIANSSLILTNVNNSLSVYIIWSARSIYLVFTTDKDKLKSTILDFNNQEMVSYFSIGISEIDIQDIDGLSITYFVLRDRLYNRWLQPPVPIKKDKYIPQISVLVARLCSYLGSRTMKSKSSTNTNNSNAVRLLELFN